MTKIFPPGEPLPGDEHSVLGVQAWELSPEWIVQERRRQRRARLREVATFAGWILLAAILLGVGLFTFTLLTDPDVVLMPDWLNGALGLVLLICCAGLCWLIQGVIRRIRRVAGGEL